jgi:hypothetical protein
MARWNISEESPFILAQVTVGCVRLHRFFCEEWRNVFPLHRKSTATTLTTRSLHLPPFHTSYDPHMSSFTPGPVSTVDFRYPFHFEPPFTALGSHPVGYPSPTFQHLSTQATFFPITSGAPSGISISPTSFCAPPSQHPGLSTMPFRNTPSDYQLEMSSVAPAPRDSQVHHILHSSMLDSSSSR